MHPGTNLFNKPTIDCVKQKVASIGMILIIVRVNANNNTACRKGYL